MLVSGSEAQYVCGSGDGASVEVGLPSSIHFWRPPFITFSRWWPYMRSCQNAYVANQLLLSP